ncbi:hypothetical protein BXZ70DRAFT_937413 [Cristinia sonorae]|uniref:B-block binding subunit of TFIIIC domain-containing protein n=1 Tax=Cristinia sonorae TaxID=1940300 RepID=A0A8K0UNE8_9AGAR|nr:hypothetical protein BXZ70DRAFT_937413 [Cristinia sonorae]
MVFTALQLIARGRAAGISTVDLSKQTGYDAKTCFYLVGKLVELNLVEKRKKAGVGSHVLIHKYFFDRSPVWQTLLAEEAELADIDLLKAEGEPDDGVDDISPADITFEPIDLRFLSSLPIVKSRVVKLLQASPHQTSPAHNLITRIGFTPAKGKTDRRFFMTRMRELMAQGVIEKVQAPHPRKKSGYIPCFRLLSAGDDKVAEEEAEDETQEDDAGENGVKGNVSLHRQIIDLIEASGTEGTTITALSKALCGFDRRIIEQLLSRLEQWPPPAHLADLGICQLQETAGRERRFRYFTMAHFHQLAKKEGMSSAYLETDMSHVGDFMEVDPDQLYDTQDDLNAFVDASEGPSRVSFPVKSKKPQKEKKAKPGKQKNPVLADGTVKKGRPRKYARGDGLDGNLPPVRGGRKRKREETVAPDGDPATAANAEEGPPPAKKRRGRPPKVKPVVATEPIADITMDVGEGPVGASEDLPPATEVAEITRAAEKIPPPEPLPDTIGTSAPKTRKKKSQPATDVSPPRRSSRRFTRGSSRADEPEPSASTSFVSNDQELLLSRAPSHAPEPPSLDIPVPLQAIDEPPAAPLGTPSPGEAAVVPDNTTTDAIDSHSAPMTDVPRANMATEETRHSISLAVPSIPRIPALDVATAPRSDIPIDPALLDTSRLIAFDPPPAGAKTVGGEGLLSKRQTPAPAAFEYPSKRAKTTGPENISQSRREKEFLQLITEAGGLANVSPKEFSTHHSKLLERMMQAGEPVSSRVPGSKVDKRTLEATLNTLEARGQIKLLTTQVTLATGSSRRVRVAYLPNLSEAELSVLLSELGQSIRPYAAAHPLRTVDLPLEFKIVPPETPVATPIPAIPETFSLDVDPNPDRAETLFRRDETSIREALLSERDTIAQLYGFIPGKAARAKVLHLNALQLFESESDSAGVVSREQRIIHFPHYYQTIPVSSYCALVACLEHNEELEKLLSTPEGSTTPVADLPKSIQRVLKVDGSRSQTRILDLLDMLHALDVVRPLRTSESANPAIQIPPKDAHPTSFDPITEDTASLPGTPQYWQFTMSAPIFLWVLRESPTRFWKDVPIGSIAEGEAFWRDVKFALEDHQGALAHSFNAMDVSRFSAVNSKMLKAFRRNRAWETSYVFSWYQTEYLRRFIDSKKQTTPLDDTQKLEQISWVSCAPLEAVKRFYAVEKERMEQEAAKLLDRTRKQEKHAEAKRSALAQKAASAKEQKERVWDEMVTKIHPQPLQGSIGVRVRRVRASFMQSSGTDLEKWEAEIVQAIEDAKIAVANVVPAPQKPARAAVPAAAPAPMPVVRTSTDKPVETLIAQQGPAPPIRPPKKKADKGKGQGKEESDVRRRHRFQWNRDYDELARDASAIIKARCRNGARLDWAALEQVFPAVPRNSVRQRIGSLREQPGADTYMKRLEEKWYEVWMQHRGMDVLPDPDPESPSNFDMVVHLKFFRAHIDKNALRIGFFETEPTSTINLPSTISQLQKSWTVVEKAQTAPTYDFMWTHPSEEAREKAFLHHAFLVDAHELPPFHSYPTEVIHVADATVKMALGTPNELYDMQAASALMKSVGEEHCQLATLKLLERGVLSKVVRDPTKTKPGKTLRISEMNQNALGGSVSADIFQDAVEFTVQPDEHADPEWREWPLLASDGETAALIELVSEGNIEFKIDTSHVKFAHNGMDWNSKKIDDDDIETTVFVRPVIPEQAREASPRADIMMMESEALSAVPDTTGHGRRVDGGVAACRKASSGPVDCVQCLQESTATIRASLNQEELSVATILRNLLDQAGPKGIKKAELVTKFTPSDALLLPMVVTRLTDASIPVLFWAGYGSVVLVSSKHLKDWTAVTSESDEGSLRVFPRRWLDHRGMVVQAVWDAALKAVTGVIVFRPGLTQAELRWRLRSVYDRHEINEVLQHLLEGEHVKRHIAREDRWAGCGLPDDEEEKGTLWTVSDKKRWYTV